MSDVESGGNQSATRQASETIRNTARTVREALDEGQTPGQAADIVRGMVREAPLLALASAFLVGVLVARRR
jgi:hypothetical protein